MCRPDGVEITFSEQLVVIVEVLRDIVFFGSGFGAPRHGIADGSQNNAVSVIADDQMVQCGANANASGTQYGHANRLSHKFLLSFWFLNLTGITQIFGKGRKYDGECEN